jgi:hypothetical protein
METGSGGLPLLQVKRFANPDKDRIDFLVLDGDWELSIFVDSPLRR